MARPNADTPCKHRLRVGSPDPVGSEDLARKGHSIECPKPNYEQLQNKLQVIRVLGAGDPARTFELLQSGIDQLNELISAAATLNGFEVEMFVSNEMPLPGNGQLGAMVVKYGQELALLANSDFRRAVAEQFHHLYVSGVEVFALV